MTDGLSYGLWHYWLVLLLFKGFYCNYLMLMEYSEFISWSQSPAGEHIQFRPSSPSELFLLLMLDRLWSKLMNGSLSLAPDGFPLNRAGCCDPFGLFGSVCEAWSNSCLSDLRNKQKQIWAVCLQVQSRRSTVGSEWRQRLRFWRLQAKIKIFQVCDPDYWVRKDRQVELNSMF